MKVNEKSRELNITHESWILALKKISKDDNGMTTVSVDSIAFLNTDLREMDLFCHTLNVESAVKSYASDSKFMGIISFVRVDVDDLSSRFELSDIRIVKEAQ